MRFHDSSVRRSLITGQKCFCEIKTEINRIDSIEIEMIGICDESYLFSFCQEIPFVGPEITAVSFAVNDIA